MTLEDVFVGLGDPVLGDTRVWGASHVTTAIVAMCIVGRLLRRVRPALRRSRSPFLGNIPSVGGRACNYSALEISPASEASLVSWAFLWDQLA